jgi:hypothetical protein
MDPFAPVGKARFLFYLNKIQLILDTADSAENPAMALYQEDLRTPLFMLEGLSRLYKKIADGKKLKKLNELFKDLEDHLGAIDYYDGFHKEFLEKKTIPQEITEYIEDQRTQKADDLNDELKKKRWIGKRRNGVSKIITELDKMDWFDEKNDMLAVQKVYRKDIKKVIKKYKRKNLHFDNIEEDVHELRRELRWLSIYPQALCGLMQVKENAEPPAFLKKYLTPEIVHSLFNVMPDGGALQYHIMLNDHYFYALSWIIAELGKLKDSGLRIEILKESLSAVYRTNEDVEQLAYSISGPNQPTIPEILARSEQIATTFFEEDILKNILT